VPPNVELVRQQWEDGHRRLEKLKEDPARYERVRRQVDALVEQLRRRVGSSFALAELAESYETAERWAYETLAEGARSPGWTGSFSIAIDSAFHLYARGARDYGP
jgi:hypothetical protein